MSWNAQPPHEEALDKPEHALRSNEHPDILHMGTRRAAMTKHRYFLHEYEMDPSAASPVTFADEPDMVERSESKNNPHDPVSKDWQKAMAGKQEGLWETVQPDLGEAVSKGIVMPYRNRAEDAGSISYAVPKSAIASGAVRYKGVTNLVNPETRRRLEQEDAAGNK